MTDGTTGTAGQSPAIAPVASEEDMKAMQTLFQRVASSIVAASEYPARLNELASQVAKDKETIERILAANRNQDDTINELRTQRDQASDQLNEATNRLHTAQAAIEGLTSAQASAEQTIAQLNDELERTRKERDQYGLDHMQALDDLKAVRDKLGQVKDRFKELLADPGEYKSDEAAPLDIPKQDYHAPGDDISTILPVSAPEPLPPEAMPEISPALPTYIDEWEPGYSWDGFIGRYKRNH